ncbi:hypothetical protein J3Q64DRAFT_1737014 [Phycomyces blakesleeanus]|uniref:Nitrogen regulatory protein areA GATA-like domain-containing protein n=1 Tax=Phycomyces blakesleeanus TaxID=4837 RepID=A0ABR3B0T2_PHYBL
MSHSFGSSRNSFRPTEQHMEREGSFSASPSSAAAALLSDSLFPPRKPKGMVEDDEDDEDDEESDSRPKEDPLATQVWRLYTKAKDNLPNGSRLENLTWRMMAMTLKKKAERTAQAQADSTDSPPPPDDTTALLSSSAPLYGQQMLGYPKHDPNVLVYGSARASSLVSLFVIFL